MFIIHILIYGIYIYISIANLPGEEGEARRQNYSPSPTGFPIWKGKL